MNFGANKTLITTVFLISLPIGSFVFGVYDDQNVMKHKNLVTIFLVMSTFAYLAIIFLERKPENLSSYIVLFGKASYLSGGPWSYVNSPEARERTSSDEEFFWRLYSNSVFGGFFVTLWMILTGYMMKKDLDFFLYYLLGLIIFNTVWNFLRKNFWEENQENQPTNNSLMDEEDMNK